MEAGSRGGHYLRLHRQHQRSAAAYGGRCGLKTIIVIPKGKIALGKLAQAIVYGAQIVAIGGNFDQALDIVRSLAEKYPVTLVNSVNPFPHRGAEDGRL